MDSTIQSPTLTYADELQRAYDHFNATLFEDRLPGAVITYTNRKKVYGHFGGKRWEAGEDHTADEIAMNPSHFRSRPVGEVLSTLGPRNDSPRAGAFRQAGTARIPQHPLGSPDGPGWPDTLKHRVTGRQEDRPEGVSLHRPGGTVSSVPRRPDGDWVHLDMGEGSSAYDEQEGTRIEGALRVSFYAEC